MLEPELWIERFRDDLAARNYSQRSTEAYSRSAAQLLAYLQESGLRQLSGLTRQHLEGYRVHLVYARYKGKPLHAKTQCLKLTAVRRFVRFLVRHDYLLVDVAAGMELPRVGQSLPRSILSEREMLRLLEAPDVSTALGLRDRAILETLYCTAIRNQELAGLELAAVDWERHSLLVHKGKGDKSRTVPLGEEAEIWLDEYLRRGRPMLVRRAGELRLFVSWRGAPLTRGNLSAAVKRWGQSAGLDKPVTPHVLRHSCATHMLKRGANLRYLQALLGHECISTTERYTRVEVSDLRKVVQRCHPREQKR